MQENVFGRSATRPFSTSGVCERSRKAWKAANAKAEQESREERLAPIGMHEARHTFASLIAAGVSPKALSTYMGHASISITLDRYGHLLPGNEAEAADLLDAYLKRAKEGA